MSNQGKSSQTRDNEQPKSDYAANLDPRNKGRRHYAEYCHLPFCKDCWAILRGNIMAIKGVADSLRAAAVGEETRGHDE